MAEGDWETVTPQRRETDWETLPGGAAAGNPSILRQGIKAQRTNLGESLMDIGGAGIAGGILGAGSSEILTGLGGAARSFPATAPMAPFLLGAGSALRAGGRTAPAISGVIGGMAGEAAGQTAEVLGAGPVTAESARIAGGFASQGTLAVGKKVLETFITKPALGLESHIKKQTAKLILEKLDGAPQTLTEKEAQFVEQMIAEIRGPQGKTNAPLERVGSIMGDEGARLMNVADRQMIAAQQQAAGVQPMGPPSTLDEIGNRLRGIITKRNETALALRSAQYRSTEQARDAFIEAKETAGASIDQQPEFQKLMSDLRSELTGAKHSPSVKAGLQKMLIELENKNETGATSFNALDEVRRKLGDVFRGKPAEGFEAIETNTAKDLYGKISDIQKKYAGPAQAKLLDDYNTATEGLEIFSSKAGKKATALDQFREGQYATDPSTLPSTFFKTKASVQALKELTGNPAQVNQAALEYADKQLVGKDGPAVRQWMTKNAEWLAETIPARTMVERYATALEASERSLKNATEFAAQAAKDNKLLVNKSLPAQRAVDLIRSGDTELWGKVIPAIQQSPQAKGQMVNAVRQVVADQATSKTTVDLFTRNIRPFLEGSNIATKAEMDFIESRLNNILTLNVPEEQKLGIAKRLLLGSTASWAATALGRGGAFSMQNLVPDEQPGLQRERAISDPQHGNYPGKPVGTTALQGTRG